MICVLDSSSTINRYTFLGGGGRRPVTDKLDFGSFSWVSQKREGKCRVVVNPVNSYLLYIQIRYVRKQYTTFWRKKTIYTLKPNINVNIQAFNEIFDEVCFKTICSCHYLSMANSGTVMWILYSVTFSMAGCHVICFPSKELFPCVAINRLSFLYFDMKHV